MITLLAKLLKVLNSETSPWAIGWAVALGLMAGLLPFGFLTLVIIVVVCLFTVNLSIFFVLWGLTGGLMVFLGENLEAFTWQHARAEWLLELLASVEALQVLHLHHSLVLGAFVLGLFLLVPVLWISAFLVKQYRLRLMARVDRWRVVQLVKASKLYQLYQTFS